MTISYVGAGAVANSTGATVNNVTAAGSVGDLLLALTGQKSYLTQPTFGAWTSGGSPTVLNSVTSGTAASATGGAGVGGSVRATAAASAALGTAAQTSLATNSSGGTVALGQGLRFAKSVSGASWVTDAVGLADTTETLTAVSATPGPTLAQSATPTAGQSMSGFTSAAGSSRWTFTASLTSPALSVTLNVVKIGSPTDSVIVDIYSTTGTAGQLGSLLGSSDAVPCSSLVTNTGTPLTAVTFTFSTPPALTADVTYYMLIRRTAAAADATNTPRLGIENPGTNAASSAYNFVGGAVAYDVPFTLAQAPEAGFFASDDWVVVHVVINDDAPNHTGQTLTIPGCTVGTITWLTKASTTSGADLGQYVGYAQITAGSSTASTVTYAATSSVSGNSGTAVNLVRLREVSSGGGSAFPWKSSGVRPWLGIGSDTFLGVA